MVKRPIHRLYKNRIVPEYDELAEETIISIFNQEELIVRLLATPQDLEDLAIGHIICEGRGNVNSVTVDGREICIAGQVTPRPSDDLLTAACGACTTSDIEMPSNIVPQTQFLLANPKELLEGMKQYQPIFDTTGGVHAAAIFKQNGEVVVVREDVGRHNAFDKAVGASLRMNFEPKIIGLSGRVGWELVAKAIRAEIEVIIAIGAISSSAEKLARSSGITIVGFALRTNPAIIGPLSRIIDKQNVTGSD